MKEAIFLVRLDHYLRKTMAHKLDYLHWVNDFQPFDSSNHAGKAKKWDPFDQSQLGITWIIVTILSDVVDFAH